jgi:hypothetical protein
MLDGGFRGMFGRREARKQGSKENDAWNSFSYKIN